MGWVSNKVKCPEVEILQMRDGSWVIYEVYPVSGSIELNKTT